VGAALTVMELIQILRAGSVTGQGKEISSSKSKYRTNFLHLYYVTMSGKFCTACGWWVDHTAFACPNCKASNFDHRDPAMQGDLTVSSTPVLQRKSQSDIEEENRLKFEESIDPVLLAKFKHRFQLELEEIAYLEWRAMQPEWKFQVMKAEKDPKSQAAIGGFVGPHAVTTAAGVFIGTTAIRTELNEMNKEEGGEGSDGSGDEEGGIFGFLDGLFE